MAICPFGQGQNECQQVQCALWDKQSNQCSIITIRDWLQEINDKLQMIVSTEENSNKHLKSIDYHSRCGCATFTKTALLMNEFLSGQDLDKNGKIYGKDFKIVDPPATLRALEDHPNWEEPAELMTMEEYLQSLPDDDIEEWIVNEYNEIL